MKKSVSPSLIAGMATLLVLMAGPGSQAQSFVDVSDSAGIINSLTRSWGSPCWGDINNDGYLDVMVSVHGVNGTARPVRLHQQPQRYIYQYLRHLWNRSNQRQGSRQPR